MNLPPPNPGCDPYAWDLYRFLQHPVFDQIRLNPRTVQGLQTEGQIYYVEDTGLMNGVAGSGTGTAVGGSYVPRTAGSWDWEGEYDGPEDIGTWTGDFGDGGGDFRKDVWANTNNEELDISGIVPSDAAIINMKVEWTFDYAPNNVALYLAPGTTQSTVCSVLFGWSAGSTDFGPGDPGANALDQQDYVKVPYDGSGKLNWMIKAGSYGVGIPPVGNLYKIKLMPVGWWLG